ncbi:hypothetical protein MJC1_04077 [Methylocystis sp. MJC1]|nr:hypothetical protein MJC1_04077 [Methylocystis sp. MJC1]
MQAATVQLSNRKAVRKHHSPQANRKDFGLESD